MRNCKKYNCPLHHYLILIRTNRHLFHDELSICNKRDFCIVFGRFEWNTEKSAWFSYDAKPSRKIHHAFVSPSQVLWLKLVIIRFALFAKWNVIMEMTVKTAKKDVLKPAKLLELRNFNFQEINQLQNISLACWTIIQNIYCLRNLTLSFCLIPDMFLKEQMFCLI